VAQHGSTPRRSSRSRGPAGIPPGLSNALRRIAKAVLPDDTPEDPAPPWALDSARLLEEEPVTRPESVVGALLDIYLPGGVSRASRTRLEAFLAEGDPVGPALNRRVREAVHAILSMAEYQLA
jgi:hypothetical protein